MINRKALYILLSFVIVAIAIIPFENLFSSGNVECELCVGECWSVIDDACGLMAGGPWYITTFDYIVAYCYQGYCHMDFKVYCEKEGDNGLPVPTYTYAGCVIWCDGCEIF